MRLCVVLLIASFAFQAAVSREFHKREIGDANDSIEKRPTDKGLAIKAEVKTELQITRQRVTQEVIDSCQRLDETHILLYNATQSAVLMNSLAVIASTIDDTKLSPPMGGFKHLRYDWFRVSLLQVGNSMIDGFRFAHSSMITIEQALSDLPTLFTSTIKHTTKLTDQKKIERYYSRINRRITSASATCAELAYNTMEAFQRVINEIDELSESSTATNSNNEKERQKREKDRADFEAERNSLQTSLEATKKRYEETVKREKEALAAYKEQVGKTGNLEELVIASLVDTVAQIPQAIISVVGARNGAGVAQGAMSAAGVNGNAQRAGNSQAAPTGNTTGTPVQNGNAGAQQNQKSGSVVEQLSRQNEAKLKSLQAHLAAESAREKDQFEKIQQTTQSYGAVIAKLQNVNVDIVNLDEVIKLMREAVEYLGQIRKQWLKLAQYFDTMKAFIEQKIAGPALEDLIENNKDLAKYHIIEEINLMTAFRYIGNCIKVRNAASIYISVSTEYIMPTVGKVTAQFGLLKSAAKEKQKSFELDFEKATNGVKALVDSEKIRLAERYAQQMIVYGQSLETSANASNGRHRRQLHSHRHRQLRLH